MIRLAAVLGVFAFALGCSGSSSQRLTGDDAADAAPADAAPVSEADAAPADAAPPDAGPEVVTPPEDCVCTRIAGLFGADPQPCDPIAQSGCETGEKCAEVLLDEEPYTVATACVPAGVVPLDGVCARGVPGAATGYDDCMAGAHCNGGICDAVCLDGANPGACLASCDPVAQDCAGEDQGCYYQLKKATGSCALVHPDADGLTQGELCATSAPSLCALNGCEEGYQALLRQFAGSTDAVCGAFCSPVDSYATHATSDPDGAEPASCSAARIGVANHGCGFVQNVFPKTSTFDPATVPATLGICFNEAEWGNCGDYDPESMVATYNAAYEAASGDATAKDEVAMAALCEYCVTDSNCQNSENPACNSGVACLSLDTEDAIFGQMANAQAAAAARRFGAGANHPAAAPLVPPELSPSATSP